MEIIDRTPADQVCPSVDLGLVAKPLPEIVNWNQFWAEDYHRPPEEIIKGVLHRGCKMVLGGTSKSNKSWSLLDLATSVASGEDWWGHRTHQSAVCYVNFELQRWSIKHRVDVLLEAHPGRRALLGNRLDLWNLRGHNSDITTLRPKLEEQLGRRDYGLIIFDPVYKLLGNRDENANGDIAGLMNELEGICQRTGAALVIAHHYAKGDSTVKSAMDRMSGAGAWTRDPDSIVVLTPHEEEDCFTVNTTLRNFAPIPEFVLEWDYPLMKLAGTLDPSQLRRIQGRPKASTDGEFVAKVIGKESLNASQCCTRAGAIFEMSKRATMRYLARISASGMICHSGGLYWTAHEEVAK